MNIRVAAIIIKNDEILLMHCIKNGREYFVCPNGNIEARENLVDALIRKVKE